MGKGSLLMSVSEQLLRLGANYFFRLIKSTLFETLTWSSMLLAGVGTGVLQYQTLLRRTKNNKMMGEKKNYILCIINCKF